MGTSDAPFVALFCIASFFALPRFPLRVPLRQFECRHHGVVGRCVTVDRLGKLHAAVFSHFVQRRR